MKEITHQAGAIGAHLCIYDRRRTSKKVQESRAMVERLTRLLWYPREGGILFLDAAL